MRRNREEAALVVECARAHGVSARAVRDWRALDDSRWGAFLHNRAKQSTFQAAELSGPAFSIDQEEESAARRYAALSSLADSAIQRGDLATLPALLRNSEQAHTTLHKVRQNVRQTREEEGRLIPREEALGVARSALRCMREAVLRLPEEVREDLEATPERWQEILSEWVALLLQEIAEEALRLEKQFPRAAREAVEALGCEVATGPGELPRLPVVEAELIPPTLYDPRKDPDAVTIEARLVPS